MAADDRVTPEELLVLERALNNAMREGRDLDAAHLALRLNQRTRAAQLFERAGDFFDAAVAWRESGQASRALGSALKIPANDPCYFAGCRLAIELSASLRFVSHDLDQFLAPYLTHPPGSREDLDSLFLLGQLYEVNEYLPHAIELYRRIEHVDPEHAAAERLRLAEASAKQFATSEVVVRAEDMRAIRQLVRAERQIVRTTRSICVGDVLANRYRLDRLLGTGSNASVFRAYDQKLQEFVALKLVDMFPKGSPQEARFRREVSLARKLSHPNVVRIYDLAEHEGRYFLTMELLEGTDLREYVETAGLNAKSKRDLLLQACDGLGYAHANYVVHRDVKPENMFVTKGGLLKVADFGMAKAPGDVSVTMTGAMGGTPHYMSPEQITDLRTVDHRTDLYALGVLAYELFTGKLPFDSTVLTELLLAHLERAPKPLRELRPKLSAELEAIVLRLLEKSRDDRFQSCAELSAALRAVQL